MKTLKELRMWHWRELRALRAMEKSAQIKANRAAETKSVYNLAYYGRRVRSLFAQGNQHLGAVQLLNDHVPGTAENDCAEEDRSASPS